MIATTVRDPRQFTEVNGEKVISVEPYVCINSEGEEETCYAVRTWVTTYLYDAYGCFLDTEDDTCEGECYRCNAYHHCSEV